MLKDSIDKIIYIIPKLKIREKRISDNISRKRRSAPPISRANNPRVIGDKRGGLFSTQFP